MHFLKIGFIQSLLIAVAIFPVSSSATITVDFIPASQWGQSDESIGLAGGVVEDFEDTSLAPGLFFEISDAAGNLTGTGTATLPNIFDPVNGDPFGDSFVTGVWDGSHCLVNTESNQSIYYGSQDWRPVGFYVPEGTVWLAIASQQVTINHFLMVNGQSMGRLETLGFTLSTEPNGVMVVRTDDETAPIFSVSFGGRGDAFTIDHVVFAPPGTLPTDSATWDSVKSLFR